MWGVVAIVVFLIVVCVEKCQEYSAGSTQRNKINEQRFLLSERGNENRIRQQELFSQYVLKGYCLTKEEFDQIKQKTVELCKTIEDPSMIEALTIDDNNPYEHPNPFLYSKICYYRRLDPYYRYLLAKKQLESEGFIWNDKFNLKSGDTRLDKIYSKYHRYS